MKIAGSTITRWRPWRTQRSRKPLLQCNHTKCWNQFNHTMQWKIIYIKKGVPSAKAPTQGGKQLLKWNSTSKSKCLMKYQKILPFNRLATIASRKTSISTRSCIAPFNRLAGQHNITAKCKG
jgi:hypothetical protein